MRVAIRTAQRTASAVSALAGFRVIGISPAMSPLSRHHRLARKTRRSRHSAGPDDSIFLKLCKYFDLQKLILEIDLPPAHAERSRT
jgi:hypothetical protein